MGSYISLKAAGLWSDLPQDLPLYSTVYWHYKQWRAQGNRILIELLNL